MSASADRLSRKESPFDDASFGWSWIPVIFVWIALALLIALIHLLPSELRAYSLLKHFADPNATGPLLRYETYDVTTQEVTITMPVRPETSIHPLVVPP